MYKHLLLPTDGSETAKSAGAHGIRLAKSLGARLTGLYVCDVTAFVGIPTHAIIGTMKALLEDEGNKALSELEKEAKKAGVKLTTILTEGVPYEVIVETANEKGCDLIVMGTHGRKGLDRLLLGSVTEKVVRTAHCPTLVVHE